MKKIIRNSIIISALIISQQSIAQTGRDTVNTPKSNDPMVVNPGTPQEGGVVNPGRANDGMAVFTDTGFIARSIAENHMEIQMAKVGASKGSAKIKKIAAKMVTDHTQMLNALQKLAQKKGIKEGKGHSMPPLPPIDEKAAQNFDAKWASAMLTMHNHKIEELEKFLAITRDEDLKLMIGTSLPIIREHKEMLEKIPGAKELPGPGTAIQ